MGSAAGGAVSGAGQKVLYAWGRNDYGQLGDGGKTNRSEPVKVVLPGAMVLDQVVSVGATDVSVRLRDPSSGALSTYTWGQHDDGQPGNGSAKARERSMQQAVAAPEGVRFVQESTGGEHTIAIDQRGGLYAWGSNDEGQLGLGTSGAEAGVAAANSTGVSGTGVSAASASGADAGGVGANGTPAKNASTNGADENGDSASKDGAGSDKANGDSANSASVNHAGMNGVAANSAAASSGSANSGNASGDSAGSSADTVQLKPRAVTPVAVTSIKFGGLASSSPQYLGLSEDGQSGQWSLRTPKHAAGEVSVEVAWSIGGVEQPSPELTFTYRLDGLLRATRTVTFDAGPDATPQTSTQLVNDGNQASWPADPARPGYVLTGWKLGGAPYDFSQPVTGDITLTADWTPLGSFSILPASGPVAGGTNVAIKPPTLMGLHFLSVSAGYKHVLALANDHNIYSWGENDKGQLGVGDTVSRNAPTLVKAPAGVRFTQAVAGYYSSAALGTDGNVYIWGATRSNRAVNEPTPFSYTLPAGEHITQLSAGNGHFLALSSGGQVYAWGDNDRGQLGDGTFNDSSNFQLVHTPAGVGFKAIAAGELHSTALTTTGDLYTWGANQYGELGDGSTTDRSTPVMVSVSGGRVEFKAVSASYYHTLALSDKGVIYSWGGNQWGQLGRDLPAGVDISASPAPVNNPSGAKYAAISAGNYTHSIALAENGIAYTWGQITGNQYPTAVDLPDGVTYTSVNAGGVFSAAFGTDGNLYAWGKPIGDGTAANSSTTPVIVWPQDVWVTGAQFDGRPGTDVTIDVHNQLWRIKTPAHSAGPVSVTVSSQSGALFQGIPFTYIEVGAHSFTFDTQGGIPVPNVQNVADGAQATRPTSDPTKTGMTFEGWFLNGSPYDFTQPVTANLTVEAHWSSQSDFTITPNAGIISGGETVTIKPPTMGKLKGARIEAGFGHSLLTASTGDTYVWGHNDSGQLGDASQTDHSSPVKISGPGGLRFTSLSAGARHTLAIGSDGRVYAWGDDSYGQLGGTGSHTVPALVPGFPNGLTFTAVSTGLYSSFALASDGSLYSWGSNGDGQLGIGSTTNQSIPQVIALPAGVTKFVAISAGYSHTLALGDDGNIYAWGSNDNGRLGDGTTTQRLLPQKVQLPVGLAKFTAISAGGYHSMAIGSDGKAYAWGWAALGQLGNGTADYLLHATPGVVQLGLPNGVQVSQISAGDQHSFAIDSEGKLHAWGDNRKGQLGDSSLTQRNSPVQITVAGVTKFTQVSAGDAYALALDDEGRIFAWGSNEFGQLGLGSVSTNPEQSPKESSKLDVTLTFDGLPASDLTYDSVRNEWTAKTPAHAEGPVDVTLGWSLGGQRHEIKKELAFSYTDNLTLPLTGGPGIAALLAGGVALMLLAAGARARRKGKENEEVEQGLAA
ncbi:hypothetical protein KIM372_00400 [Bombiscardovia nodaiensis]|uniref:RCC1-like domain-containing protein n=1 Tax=Bombiscardovia nodaiensis TaxID=2932181 RepID=A0ABM8B5M2_9BIFI|nr:hypothetical protein KIM372_00400 [Bombiscardovia nodaiensis]